MKHSKNYFNTNSGISPSVIILTFIILLFSFVITAKEPFKATTQDIKIKEEWRRTKPDVVVYIPKNKEDGDNEHFLVFKAPKSDELLAIWTQSSVEGRGDNRAVIARSKDGKNWADPEIIAGKSSERNESQASWAFPVVSNKGRIYCFFSKDTLMSDKPSHCGLLTCYYSDDNGYTWNKGKKHIDVPKFKYDNPDSEFTVNWIVWQIPIRDGQGKYFTGYTRWSSDKVVKRPTNNWTDSRGTASMNIPGQPVRFRRNNLSRPDMQSELKREVTLGNIDDGYIETYGLRLIAGRNFEQPNKLDSAKVIISESTAKLLGFSSPETAVGRQLRMGNTIFTTKGVVNDFHHEGLKKPSEPIIFTHTHPREFGYYSFRIQGNVQNAIDQLQKIWPKHYPNDPLDYFFSKEYFNLQYNEERRLNRVLTAFTVFAIMVTSLGLFGLISFFAQERTKEIGLRKLNGATIIDIMLLLLTYFLNLEIIAFLLSCPLAFLVINKWIQGFAYQTTITWWIFIMTGAIVFIISIASIISQSYRAATKNPAEALMYE